MAINDKSTINNIITVSFIKPLLMTLFALGVITAFNLTLSQAMKAESSAIEAIRDLRLKISGSIHE